MRHRVITVLIVLLSLACGSAEAWAQKIGPEFRVNTNTTNGQRQKPAVARLSDGGYVVVWQSSGYQDLAQDGSQAGVFGQRYDAEGKRVGGEFRVNSYTPDDQADPSVAGLAGGGFVVAWASFAQDGSRNGVYGQRYSATGAPAGSEFKVNTYTNLDQEAPSGAALSGGGFVVVWQSREKDGSSYGIFAQRYDAAGARVGGEFRVNSHTTFAQWHPSAVGLTNGGFVVTWESSGQDNSGAGIYGQRYSATATRVGGEFPVNPDLPSADVA